MALLRVEAERLAANKFISGVVETIYTSDPLYEMLDFIQSNAKAEVYNREVALPTTAFKAPGATITESTGRTEEVIARLRAIIGDVDVDSFLAGTMSGQNSQKGIQIAMKVKATARKFRDAMINGGAYSATITAGNPVGFITSVSEVSDANGEGSGNILLTIVGTTLTYTAPGDTAGAGTAVSFAAGDGTYTLKSGSPSRWIRVVVDASELGAAIVNITATIVATDEFTGIKKFCPPSQIIQAATNGAALSYAKLDELLDTVQGADVDAILMPKRTIRAYKALLRTSGGLEPAMVMNENLGRKVLTYNDVPIIPNEFISLTEACGTSGAVCGSVYAVSLQPGYGLQGIYGGENAGIQKDELGPLETKDATRTRIKWYTALRLGSELAIARLEGVTN